MPSGSMAQPARAARLRVAYAGGMFFVASASVPWFAAGALPAAGAMNLAFVSQELCWSRRVPLLNLAMCA